MVLGLALDHFEYLERSVVQLDERIDALMAEHSTARDRLDTIPGVGKRAAEIIIVCSKTRHSKHFHTALS